METRKIEKTNVYLKYINTILKENKLSHAYLFSGSNENMINNNILMFVKSLFCINNKNREYYCCDKCDKCLQINKNNYIDFYIVDAEKSIKKEDILNLKEELNLKPIYSKKIYWIKNIENITSQAANSLLKTLEEPEDDIVAILSTKNINSVLDTIISRCQIIKLPNTEEKIVENDKHSEIKKYTLEFIEKYVNNKNLSLIYLTDKISQKDDILIFFNEMLNIQRINIEKIAYDGNNEIIRLYDMTLESIQDIQNNTSPVLVLESYIINLILNNINLEWIIKYYDKR